MIKSATPVLGFAAWSGTGKTTLLKQIIPLLKSRGIRIGMIKHAHHNFDIDKPGKDSYELRKAGAEQMLITSKNRWAVMVETPGIVGDPDLNEMIQQLDHSTLDLILVEGFKHVAFTKIELHRPALGKALLYPNDNTIIAVATDSADATMTNLPILDLNNPANVAEFIIEFINQTGSSIPTTGYFNFYPTSLIPMNSSIPVKTDCDTGTGWLSVEQARARMCDSVKVINGFERVAIRDGLNRILAEDVISPVNVPPYDNSAMDGYAIRAADLPKNGEVSLKVTGSSFAGTPFTGETKSGEAIRIMTGAQVPRGLDTVIMQEQVEREGDNITVSAEHKKGQNVRYIGEDIQQGGPAMTAGKKIGPAELGLLASLGIPEVTVKPKLRVAFFSTGDELRAVGEPLGEGQIYDSNRYTLFGMLTQLGFELIDMGMIPDDRVRIENAFNTAASLADAVITSGGVSVGEADYVKETLDKLGEINFWKISMKPGKPLAFGNVNGAAFIGLPGNPVSVMVTFYQFALPALRRMMGQNDVEPVVIKVPCKSMLKKRPGRTDFQRGVLSRTDKGELVVDGIGIQGSHILSGMSKANCFIILPAESGNIEAGCLVDVQPFFGLL